MKTLIVRQFEGHDITVVDSRGRPCVVAAQVGEAIGYEPGALERCIRRWRDRGDLIEGQDFAVIRDGAFVADITSAAKSRAITVLFESGYHTVCLLTEKPAGRRLRRWLADEVLPEIMRTGGYTASTSPSMSPQDIVALVTGAVTATLTAFRTELSAMRDELREVKTTTTSIVSGAITRAQERSILDGIKQAVAIQASIGPLRRAQYGKRFDDRIREAIEFPRGNGRRWRCLPTHKFSDAQRAIEKLRSDVNAAKQAADEAAQQELRFKKN